MLCFQSRTSILQPNNTLNGATKHERLCSPWRSKLHQLSCAVSIDAGLAGELFCWKAFYPGFVPKCLSTQSYLWADESSLNRKVKKKAPMQEDSSLWVSPGGRFQLTFPGAPTGNTHASFFSFLWWTVFYFLIVYRDQGALEDAWSNSLCLPDQQETSQKEDGALGDVLHWHQRGRASSALLELFIEGEED